MKQLFVSAIQFFGLCIVVYLISFACLFFIKVNDIPLIYQAGFGMKWKGGGSYQRFQEFEPTSHYDVLFLGSSRARQGYDPRLFEEQGISAFNLGTSAQTMLHSYLLAKEYINQESTDLLILDIYPGSFIDNGIEPSTDLLQNLPSERVAWEIAWKIQDIRAINLMTLRWFSKTMPPMYESKHYSRLGFEERQDSVSEPPQYIQRHDEPDPQYLNYLTQLLQHCQQEEIQVVAVHHPQPKEYDEEVHEAFINQLRPIVENQGAKLWDYGFTHDLNSQDHYYDHHHLNQSGVKIFNGWLLERLEEEGMLSKPLLPAQPIQPTSP